MGKMNGKVGIITGAARGIGAAAARLFAQEGAAFVMADTRAELLRSVAAEIGAAATPQVADVSQEEAVRDLVGGTMEHHGRIDFALLNAGIVGPVLPFKDYPTEQFDLIMAVNVRSLWLGLKYVMAAMEATGGSIVVTSSAQGIRATPNRSGYTASKHAAVGLMRSAALEGASRRIRVNAVNPSRVDTPMVREGIQAADNPAGADLARAPAIPMGRWGLPEEVAKMMLFLSSEDASFCTGGVYMVDGGVSAGQA